MKIWYSCKVKYMKQNDEGLMKAVTEAFLVDAYTYTEAESRIYQAMEQNIAGEFSVHSITKTNISEVINYDDQENWFKCKVTYSTVDGDSEKEVKINTYFLVSAEHVKEAFERVEDNLSSMLVPFDVPSITLTNIIEVYPFAEEEEKIPDNLKPIEEEEVEEEEVE